jgi:hypothetical protein
MAITVTDVQRVVGSNDAAATQMALDMAEVLITDALSRAYRVCPSTVRDSLVLEVAKAWFDRAQTNSGASQFADMSTGRPVMSPRDPLMTVWPILHHYVTPF